MYVYVCLFVYMWVCALSVCVYMSVADLGGWLGGYASFLPSQEMQKNECIDIKHNKTV